MTPSTETWLISTISKRLERIAEGKEPMAEDRALTLLSILKDVAGDIPSLTSLPQHVKEWLEAAINARLDAIAEKREIAAEDRIATLTEALAALRPPAAPGGSVERVDTGAGLSGGPITTTGTISLSTSSQQAIAKANTAVQPEDLADVATSGNYADLTNTPTIPEQFNPIQGANMLITGTYPNITFSAVAGEEFTPVWGEIQGTLADQTDLQDALDGKAPTVHTHTWGQITGAPVYTTRWPTWGEVVDKPLNYPTTWSLVGGKPSTFPSTWATVSGKPDTATRWPSWGEVTGKPAIPDPSDFVASAIPNLDPIAEIESGNYGTVIQPFRIGRNSSIDPPNFSTNNSPYLWLGSSGSSGQQGALIAVHAASASSNQQMAFRGRSGSGWGPWSYLWHSGNFDPDSKAPVANPVFEGDLTVSTSLASGGVIVERRNQPYNSSIEYKTTAGSIWAGYGNNGTIGFSVGGSSNLTGSNTWFKAQDGAAYIYQGSAPREVYHEGNLSISTFVQQPGGSWWTDVTSTASQDSLALRFQTPSHTRYFGVGNDGTLRTSTSNQFSSGDLVLTSGNTTPMSDNGISHVSNDWDAINKTGVYHNTTSGAVGAPASNLWMTVWHSENGGGAATQIAQRVASNMYWMRARNTNGVWGSWSALWHSNNFDPSTKFDTPTGSTSQYIRGNGSLATFPSIPTSSDYVATSGNQSNLSGNKTWTGNHTFTSSSNTDSLTVARTGSTARNAYVTYSTNATTIYAGIANINDTTWGIGTNPNLTSNNVQFRFDTSNGNMSASGNVTATNLTATSDPRLKDDIKKVKARRELIEKLEYFSFKWKKDGVAGRSVMADKVQEIAPEHVHVGDDEFGTLSVDKGALALEMVMALIEKLREEQEQGEDDGTDGEN